MNNNYQVAKISSLSKLHKYFSMHSQQGFTLIELIIVIVIVGILVVTAAPRFFDLTGDANKSTLQGVRSAMQGGAQLVYAKAAIAGQQEGVTAADNTIEVGGQTIRINYGYPDAAQVNATNIAGWLQVDVGTDGTDGQFRLISGAPGSVPDENSFGLSIAGDPASFNDDTACGVIYTNATGPADTPDVTVVDSGC